MNELLGEEFCANGCGEPHKSANAPAPALTLSLKAMTTFESTATLLAEFAGVASSLELIASATSGVAVFTVGLTLAAHSFSLSRLTLLGTLGRVTIQTAALFLMFHLLSVRGTFAREALVCTSFPMATAVVLFAARYKAQEAETASILLLSTLSLLVTVPRGGF